MRLLWSELVGSVKYLKYIGRKHGGRDRKGEESPTKDSKEPESHNQPNPTILFYEIRAITYFCPKITSIKTSDPSDFTSGIVSPTDYSRIRSTHRGRHRFHFSEGLRGKYSRG